MMVGGDLGNGVIDNIDKEWPRNSSYEGGDINDTIPSPPLADDKMVGGDPGNGVYL